MDSSRVTQVINVYIEKNEVALQTFNKPVIEGDLL